MNICRVGFCFKLFQASTSTYLINSEIVDIYITCSICSRNKDTNVEVFGSGITCLLSVKTNILPLTDSGYRG